MADREDLPFDIEEMQELREDNGLSDLKLGEIDDEENTKKRRILIISAGLLIIFLVMLVATKAFNSGEEGSDDGGYLLPPEPTVEDKDAKALFQPVEVEPAVETKSETEDDREEFSKIIQDLKAKEKEREDKALSTDDKLKAVEDVTKKIEEAKAKEIQKEVKEKITPPAKVEKAEKAKVIYPTGKFFVQVGATSRSQPDKKFLQKLDTNNLNYTTLEVAVNGMRVNKILVGPYPTKESALKELPTIRRYIARDAFIYKAQ
jgi:DedD protein